MLETLQAAPDGARHDGRRMMPTLQERPQEHGMSARGAVGDVQTQPKREAATSKAVEVRMLKPLGTQIQKQCALDDRCGDVRFNIYPAGFWSCFGPNPSLLFADFSPLE